MAVFSGPNVVENGLVFCVDAGNPKSYSPNVLPNSRDLFAWFTGTNGACNIARDTSIVPSPAGGIPLKMSITGNDPYMATYNAAQYNLAPASSGQTWTASVWARASTNTTGEIFLFADSVAGSQVFTILDFAAGTVNITTEWTRVSFSHTFTNVGTQRVQVRVDGTQSGGSGIDIWWDGLQVERGSSASAFNPALNLNGTVWADISGLAFNSTLTNGPTYTAGPGGYFTFDGVDDLASVPVNAAFNTASVTFEVWAYLQTIDDRHILYVNWQGNALEVNSNRSVAMYNYSSGGQLGATTSGSVFNWDTWNHFVGVYDDSAQALYTYVNGALLATRNTTASTIYSVGTHAISGVAFGGEVKGRISTVRHYNIALSPSQILQNFNAHRGRYGI